MAYEDIKQYSDLVHEASTYGGADAFKKAIAEKAVKTLEESKYLAGFSDGQTKGLLKGVGIGGTVVAALAGCVFVGKKVWDDHKVKVEQRKMLEEQAEEAKKVLLGEDISTVEETEVLADPE